METEQQAMEVAATEAAEKPAEEVVDKAAVDATGETPEQKAARDAKGRYSKPPEERIAEITLKHREQERETAYWRQRAEAREAAESAAASAKAAEKPTPDKFNDYSEYVEALTEWKAEQKIEAKLAERDKKSAAEKQAESRQKTWAERTAATLKALPDYEQVISSAADTQIADHVVEILNDSEHGPRLLYHFAKHPDIAERINKLPATAAAREVGRIEAGFEAESASSAAPESTETEETVTPPARRTQAPPPARPVGSGRSSTKTLADAPMEEFKARRKAEGARWAR